MALARQAKLPIIIHCREAWSDCLKIDRRTLAYNGPGRNSPLLYRHAGGCAARHRHGFLISFAGNVTYPKAQNIRDVCESLRLENILMETDSPYLAPQAHRGKRNEPAYVAEVAQTIANVRNLAPDEVAAADVGRIFGASSVLAGRRASRPSGLKETSCMGGHAIALLTVKEIFDLVRDDLAWSKQELALQSGTAIPVSEITAICWAAAGSVCARRFCCFLRGYAGTAAIERDPPRRRRRT